jgi:type I restriction enzyme S subunit
MKENNNIPIGYKDSAVGIIPQEWEVKSLGDLLARLANGLTYDVSITSGYPVSRIETISGGEINYTKVGYIDNVTGCESYRMQKGDILYSHINSLTHVGKVAYYDGKQDLYHGMNLLLLRVNEKVDSNYLYAYLLTSQAKHIAQMIAKPAVNQASISTSDIRKIKLPIPPMAEQKKIAEILGVWDEAIEKQNLLIEKLELRKRALMQRLLTGKTRLHGFTEPWQKVKLGEISTIKKGVQVNKNTLQEYGKYPTINGGIEPSGYSDNYNTEANTITISEGGNSCGYVNFITTKFWSGGHCYTITPLNNIKNLYLYHQLKYFEPRIMIQRVGSGLPNIQFNMLIKFECFLPTLLEQTAIAEVLNTADKEIAIHSKTLDALRLQKRGLMQQLLTGKTRVKI